MARKFSNNSPTQLDDEKIHQIITELFYTLMLMLKFNIAMRKIFLKLKLKIELNISPNEDIITLI